MTGRQRLHRETVVIRAFKIKMVNAMDIINTL